MIFWQAGFFLIILDALIFFAVAGKIGFFAALGLLILSALIGGALVRAQGLVTLLKVRESLDRGVVPVDALYESLCLLIAGFLFILPGFISDFLGLILLVPVVRGTLRGKAGDLFGLRPAMRTRTAAGDGVIEGTFKRVDDEKPAQLPTQDKDVHLP